MTRLAACLMICASWASAGGTLTHAWGVVSVESNGASRKAKTGDSLMNGVTVRTGADSGAVIVLEAGTFLKLRQNSSLTLQPTAGPLEVLLGSGGVFSRIDAPHKSDFRVRTPTAVAAVRGTEFFTAYGREGKRGRDLWVCVNRGKVVVEVLETKKSIEVAEGRGIVLFGGRDLTPPQAYDWTKKLNWNMDPAKGRVEDKTSLEGAYSDLLDQDYQ